MAGVRFDRVTKRFGDVTALDELTLEIRDAEFVVLVGPSGSGKTTALRLLAGLEVATEGSITIGDRAVDRLPPRDRDIAMVFQDYALYPQMTVYKNMAFALRMRKTPKAEIDDRVRRAAEMLDIGNLLERTPRELSGGQRQRVALGRALVREPAVFLMDEPLSNLDAQLRVQTRSEIKRLQQQVATTTVYVTHDQVEAMTMGDRVAVMHDGVLEQVADTRTIYERPANTFVAGFIGSPAMSFATLGTSRDAGGLTLRGEGLALTVPTPGAVDVPPEVVVGVRPEHTHLWRDDGMLGPLHGRASFVEMLGRETLIGVETGAGRFTVLADADTKVAVGDSVSFGVDGERVYLFDPATTAAIGVI